MDTAWYVPRLMALQISWCFDLKTRNSNVTRIGPAQGRQSRSTCILVKTVQDPDKSTFNNRPSLFFSVCTSMDLKKECCGKIPLEDDGGVQSAGEPTHIRRACHQSSRDLNWRPIVGCGVSRKSRTDILAIHYGSALVPMVLDSPALSTRRHTSSIPLWLTALHPQESPSSGSRTDQ